MLKRFSVAKDVRDERSKRTKGQRKKIEERQALLMRELNRSQPLIIDRFVSDPRLVSWLTSYFPYSDCN